MNDERFDEVQDESSERTHDLFDRMFGVKVNDPANRLLAEETTRSVMEEKVEAGEILRLTDEEDRLIRSFRQFKAKLRQHQKRAPFKWFTSPVEGIVEPPETVLIEDPSAVAGPEG